MQKNKRLGIFGILFSTPTHLIHVESALFRAIVMQNDRRVHWITPMPLACQFCHLISRQWFMQRNTSEQRFENVFISITRIWNTKMQLPLENIIVISQIIARENKYLYDTPPPRNCTFVSNIFSYHPQLSSIVQRPLNFSIEPAEYNSPRIQPGMVYYQPLRCVVISTRPASCSHRNGLLSPR